MSVFIGSTTPSQRACLSKEFKKLYAKKTFIPRKQKIAIALNTCDVGIKGVKTLKYYIVVFKILRSGSYNEDVMVEASDAKQAKKIGEKIIRYRFPRTKMEFVEVYEVK
jgi:hypothetical protein